MNRTTLLTFLLLISASQLGVCQNTNEEKMARLSCTQLKQLSDLAGNKFVEIRGKIDSSQLIDKDHKTYFSLKSFGIEGSSRIYEAGIIKDAFRTTLYFGVDGKRSTQHYDTIVNDLDRCLLKSGFEKNSHTIKAHGSGTLLSTVYINFDLRLRIRVIGHEPLVGETKDGKLVAYIPFDLIEVRIHLLEL